MNNNEVFSKYGPKLDNQLGLIADTFKWIWFHGWEAGQQYLASNTNTSNLLEKIKSLEEQLSVVTDKFDTEVDINRDLRDIIHKHEKDVKYFKDLSQYWFEQAH